MIPVNAKTGHQYQGKNAAFLAMAGFKSLEWATFLQWKEMGFTVIKGSKSQKIMKIIDIEKDDKKKEHSVRTYSVFNKDQVKKAKEVK